MWHINLPRIMAIKSIFLSSTLLIRRGILKNKYNVFLVAIILLSALLRLNGITYQGHWHDELFSAWASDPDNSLETVLSRTIKDVHPPLYQLILWLLYNLFGYSESVGRYLSAIVGIFSIPALYYLGKELVNRNVGLYSSLLASMNYFLIYYSQETRSYSLLFLLTVVTNIFFIKIIKKQNIQTLSLYIFSSILLIYTHYFGFLVLVSQVIYFIFYKYRRHPAFE